ncbi:MAG: glycosyltransferase [Paraglaciecola sp.]|nr:glycosyltransferase [Paraglaciecola sp.]NCT49255.1 glycosyltransferase [Paraglaciecola sp.]
MPVNLSVPKLSVIVPAYNLQDYIEACLLSVLEQQTDFAYEVMVCDDCSTDSTAQRIADLQQRFPDKLKAIFKPQNQGLAQNMLTLLAACQGDYIAYLDGDDLALAGKLQRQVDYLDSHADCQMVYHESDMFDSASNKSIKYYSSQHYNWSHIPQRSGIEDLIRYGTYLQASSVMFRRHAHLAQTVALDCRIIFDYPFYILNAGFLQANIDFMPEVLGRYRIHDTSFGAQTSRSVTRRQQSLADIEHACVLAKQFAVADEVIAEGIAHHRFAAALYFLSRDEHQLFLHYIEAASADGRFFNDKHQLAYELRHQPSVLKKRIQEMA